MQRSLSYSFRQRNLAASVYCVPKRHQALSLYWKMLLSFFMVCLLGISLLQPMSHHIDTMTIAADTAIMDNPDTGSPHLCNHSASQWISWLCVSNIKVSDELFLHYRSPHLFDLFRPPI